MTFHLKPGELNPDAPDVWGCPRLSAAASLWLVDWFTADRKLEGVTVAQGDALEWIRANPQAVAAMQSALALWKAQTPAG